MNVGRLSIPTGQGKRGAEIVYIRLGIVVFGLNGVGKEKKK